MMKKGNHNDKNNCFLSHFTATISARCGFK